MYRAGSTGLEDFRSRGHGPVLEGLMLHVAGKSYRVMVKFPWPPLPKGPMNLWETQERME